MWKYTYYVGRDYTNQSVWVRLDAPQRLIRIEVGKMLIKAIPLKGLYGQVVDYQYFLGLICDPARSEWKDYLWRQRLKAPAKAS